MTTAALRSQVRLRTRDLTVRYFGADAPAVQGLDLELLAGEAVLLLGPSGSGKSTLGLTLSGLIPHSIGAEVTGHVELFDGAGTEVPARAFNRHVGLVFQDPESQFILGHVGEEVAFGLENLGVAPAEMPPRIAAALGRAGLPGIEELRLDWLSGGQKQRVAIASVLVREPLLLVLDEPTANLDPAGAEALFAWLAEWRQLPQRPTLLLIEHQLEAALPLLDRVIVLGRGGGLLADGPPAEVFARHGERLLAEGVWVPDVLRLALAEGCSAGGPAARSLPLSIADGVAWLRARGIAAATTSTVETPRSGTAETPRRTVPKSPRPPAPKPLVTVKNLTFAYPGQPPALENISLDLLPGRLTALVGPNGSGKSTLASILAGLRKPPAGTVFWEGSDMARLPSTAIAAQVGYVFQNPEHQFLTQRVADEIAYGWRLQGMPAAEQAERGEALLRRFGLWELRERSPYSLSQGQKRRLSVATMIALGQRLLILDEPTFGQDLAGAAAMAAELERLRDEGLALLVITHDMRLVARLADTVVALSVPDSEPGARGPGRVRFTGPPVALFSDADVLQDCRLTPPPLVALWHEARQTWPGLPYAPDVAAWRQAIAGGEPSG